MSPPATIPKLLSLADIAAEIDNITPVWKGWAYRGFVSLVAGNSGDGKSYVALDIAATLAGFGGFPDGTAYTGRTGSVLWCDTEAGEAMLYHRIGSVNLPADMIKFPLPQKFMAVSLDSAEHREAIQAAARLDSIAAVAVDSLSAATRKDENTSQMLDGMMWLAGLARDVQKPVFVVHHVNKELRPGVEIQMHHVRGHGSILQAARVVWGFDMPDPMRPGTKRLRVIKSNLAELPPPVGVEIDASGVRYVGAPGVPRRESVVDRATEFLIVALKKGPLPQTQLVSDAAAESISAASLKKAKERLGIVPKKEGMGPWLWGLQDRRYTDNEGENV